MLKPRKKKNSKLDDTATQIGKQFKISPDSPSIKIIRDTLAQTKRELRTVQKNIRRK